MGRLLPVPGVRIGTACAGIKQYERDDIVVIELVKTASVAAVFTQNKFCAAPVIVAQSHLQDASPCYVLINSGNANAGLGKAGVDAAERCCNALAGELGVTGRAVLPFSTGVIGEPLPADKIILSLPEAIKDLNGNHWSKAASAILTTDTREKAYSCEVMVAAKKAVITGVAKGSGMIRPDMATMLAYIATDISIDKGLLHEMLKEAVEYSFNRITVDGDTSTNDAVVLIASGVLEVVLENRDSPGYADFFTALVETCQFLAKEIVRDGEGATKLIRIQVEKAASTEDAKELAYTIAHSPLVKTTFFASDPNWGRILAAAGRANIERLEVDKINIHLDEICIVRGGVKAKDYTEAAGQRVLSRKEITVRLDLEQGDASAEVLSCDLSYDYVKINAEYRT